MAGFQAGMYLGPAGMIGGAIIGASIGAAAGAVAGGIVGYRYGTDRAIGMAYYMTVFGVAGAGIGCLYGGGIGGAAITLEMAFSGAMMGGKLGMENIANSKGMLYGGSIYNLGYNEKNDRWSWGDFFHNSIHMSIGITLNYFTPGMGFTFGAALELDQYYGFSAKTDIDLMYWVAGNEKWKNEGLFGYDEQETHPYDRGRDLYTWSI